MVESVDAKNKLEDLSGVVLQPGENPYEALIKACNDNVSEIQGLYSVHRATRNAQQRAKFLVGFKEVLTDPILMRLEDPALEPGFKDERNCMVLWARPPEHVLKLASHVQRLLKEAAPNLWLMPTHRMHMTVMEVTHSRTPDEIAALVTAVRPMAETLASFTHSRRTRLVKPMVSHDLAAVALSFLPAAGELVTSPPAVVPNENETTKTEVGPGGGKDDSYSYHHLRRDLFEAAREATGTEMNSRYVVPSAHITLGRFLSQTDHATAEQRERWLRAIDDVNAWLEAAVWGGSDSCDDGAGPPGAGFIGEWMVGQERGLDLRIGPLWYGGGRTVITGEGF